MTEEFTVTIDASGAELSGLCNANVDYADLGNALGSKPAIERASHVEPTGDGEWIADMGPSEGPVLGPFKKRKEALEAEVAWLRENRGV